MSVWLVLNILSLSVSQNVAYPNETFELSEFFDNEDQLRTYHVAYWNDFVANDPSYKYPVLYVLHGARTNASYVFKQSTLHIDACPRGYLVVYPDGFMDVLWGNNNFDKEKRSWNAGICCKDATKGLNYNKYESRDSQYLISILQDLTNRESLPPIDEKKVFIAGFSNGGRMAIRMACEYSNVITAIAPIAGSPAFAEVNPCHVTQLAFPKDWSDSKKWGKCGIDRWYVDLTEEYLYECDMTQRVVPIISFNGYTDPITLWEGGDSLISESTIVPTHYTARWYAKMAGCNDWNADILEIYNYGNNDGTNPSDPTISYYNIDPTNSDDNSTCILFQNGCTSHVEFCTAWYGGHTWPDGDYACDGDEAKCQTFMLTNNISRSVNANNLMLNLFDTLTL